VPFEHNLIDLKNKPASFLAKSLTGKVPLLELEDGSTVSESTVIARHIATEFTAQTELLPAYDAPLVDAFIDLWTTRVEPAYYGILSAEDEGDAKFATVGFLEALRAVEDQLWVRALQAS